MRQENCERSQTFEFACEGFYDLQQRKVLLALGIDEHECYGLLLEWCRAVCANYDVGVNDFFKVLC